MQYASNDDGVLLEAKIDRVREPTQQQFPLLAKHHRKGARGFAQEGKVGVERGLEIVSKAGALGLVPAIGRANIRGGLGAKDDAVAHASGRSVARTSSQVRSGPSTG